MSSIVLIAIRFLKSKDKKSTFSLMAIISIIGVSFGVMIPVIVLSTLVGFQEEIKSKILGIKGHIIIDKGDNTYISNYDDFIKELKLENKEIVSAVPYTEMQGLVQFYNSFEPVIIKAIEQEAFMEDEEFNQLFRIKKGKKDLSKRYYALIGDNLANNYFISPQDRLKIFIVEKSNFSSNISPVVINTRVEGTFETGFQDFDIGVIYVSLNTIQKQFNREGQVKSIDLKLKNIWNTEAVKKKLVERYGRDYSFYTWQEINFNFFKALTLEKALMYMIMSLILLVAIFNIMSSQLILVIERKREIGILKTIGMKSHHLIRVFLLQGLIISSIGSLLGGIVGYAISFNTGLLIKFIEGIINIFIFILYFIRSIFNSNIIFIPFELFPKGVYYLNAIPSDPSFLRVIFFITLAMVLALVCSFFPAYRATKLKPIEVMRNE